MQSQEKYILSVNYNENGKSFQDILKKHIENILKGKSKPWNLQNFDVKYN